jgi:hypothetical protein
MMWQLGAVAVLLGVIALWNVTVVAVLRGLGIRLPFSLPFRYYPRNEQGLLEALKGKQRTRYVLISGLFLFAFPLFAGLIAADYFIRRFIEHSRFNANYFSGSVVIFVLLSVTGIWNSVHNWKRFPEKSL